MGINHIVVFEDKARMNISINEKVKSVQDVTLIHGSDELVQIMELIAHKDIKQAIKCLACNTVENKYSRQVIDILNCYN